MDWVIYCSGKPIPTQNFQIGMENKIWGNKNDIYGEFEIGDVVLFVHSLEGGKGRVNLENFSKGRTIRKLVKVVVTEKAYEEHLNIWSDDTYPYRFNFKIISEEENVEISRKTHKIPLLDGIRRASIAGNNLAKFNFPAQVVSLEQIEDDLEAMSDSESDEMVSGSEGKGRFYVGFSRERDPKLVQMAIKIHGLHCFVCNFNFEEYYGDWGKGYIEVHHLKQISDYDEEGEETDPATDLVPLCSNCHRMIHRKKKMMLSLDELRDYYNDENM
jgi:hypothetical protein